jgi:signal transduction histidine kinase
VGTAARHPRRAAGQRGDLTASGATTQIGARRNRDRPGWPVVVAFMAVGTVLGLVGRTTLLPETEFATVWPSAGVAVLWLLVRRASLLSIDTALLFGSLLAFAMLSGLPDWVAWVLAPAHTLQTVVVVALLRRWLPDLWGCGGRRALDSPRSLAVYLACIAGGVLASAVPVGIVWVTMGDPDAGMDVLLWMGRNICGILLVTTSGLLLCQHLTQPRPRRRLWEGSTWELVAACFTSVTVYVVVFLLDAHALLFLSLGVVIWFGVRFGTLMNALHKLVLGYLAIWATIQGYGPFAQDDPMLDALLVQLFVIAIASMGLALSTGLDERIALHSELLHTSEEMTYQAQLLHAVVNSMAEGLAVVDDSGRWLLRNPAATRVGGLAGDLRGMLAAAPGDQDPLALALAGETVRDMELEVAAPPGRILAVSAAPLPPDSVTGRARALLIFRDATVEHARRVDLSAFAAVVAHDLRNPLAGVESWTEMMAGELADGEVDLDLLRDYIDRVGTGTRRMKHLIDDLLDRATHDSALQLRRVDVAALATEVARDRGANGHVKIGRIPHAHADPALVRQVLENLIGNALKFVPPGAEPAVVVSGRRTDSGTVAITVADEGVGLPSGSHDGVFEPHHREHPAYEGRGLGLAICRRIVERHGGAITARDNDDGTGAVFEFTLPSPD